MSPLVAMPFRTFLNALEFLMKMINMLVHNCVSIFGWSGSFVIFLQTPLHSVLRRTAVDQPPSLLPTNWKTMYSPFTFKCQFCSTSILRFERVSC